MVEELARMTGNLDMVRVHVDDQMDSKSLLGAYVCTSNPEEFVWQPGPLTQVGLCTSHPRACSTVAARGHRICSRTDFAPEHCRQMYCLKCSALTWDYKVHAMQSQQS